MNGGRGTRGGRSGGWDVPSCAEANARRRRCAKTGAPRCSLRGVSTDADAPSPDPIAEGAPEAPVEAPPTAEPPSSRWPRRRARGARRARRRDARRARRADARRAAPAPAEPARRDARRAAPAADAAPAEPKKAAKPKRKRPPRARKPNIPKDLPRSRAPLPLDELRDASRATLDLYGREGVREAFLILAPRERQDISALIAGDEDHRPRTRNIANGSLGAGRIDKAMSATIISMAKVEDLWAITLDKESAAEKSGRIRAAKQRDKEKADRAKERANRADRVSREDMAKARDGSVGATIRIVTDEKRDRRKKGDQPPAEEPKRESVLDKLGY